jgi:hypothetical protein
LNENYKSYNKDFLVKILNNLITKLPLLFKNNVDQSLIDKINISDKEEYIGYITDYDIWLKTFSYIKSKKFKLYIPIHRECNEEQVKEYCNYYDGINIPYLSLENAILNKFLFKKLMKKDLLSYDVKKLKEAVKDIAIFDEHTSNLLKEYIEKQEKESGFIETLNEITGGGFGERPSLLYFTGNFNHNLLNLYDVKVKPKFDFKTIDLGKYWEKFNHSEILYLIEQKYNEDNLLNINEFENPKDFLKYLNYIPYEHIDYDELIKFINNDTSDEDLSSYILSKYQEYKRPNYTENINKKYQIRKKIIANVNKYKIERFYQNHSFTVLPN